MSKPVSIQLFSLRDDCEADLEGTLAKLKEFGYDGVEPYTFHGRTAEEFRRILDNVGLKCTSFHTGLEVYINDGVEKTVEDRITVGCEVVAFPYLLAGYRGGEDKFKSTCEYAAKIIELYSKEGIKLLFHNHEGDAYPLEGQTKGSMDILFEETEVLPEADTAWLCAAGIDPVDFFKKYDGKVPAIHIKDFSYTDKIPERVCRAVGRTYVWSDDAPEHFEFRTLGQGIHDIPRTVKAAVAAGCKHIIVEQDNPTPGMTALECAKMNIEYLRSFEF